MVADITDITRITKRMIKAYPNIPDLEVAHTERIVYCLKEVNPISADKCLSCKYYWGEKNDNTVYCSFGHEVE